MMMCDLLLHGIRFSPPAVRRSGTHAFGDRNHSAIVLLSSAAEERTQCTARAAALRRLVVEDHVDHEEPISAREAGPLDTPHIMIESGFVERIGPWARGARDRQK